MRVNIATLVLVALGAALSPAQKTLDVHTVIGLKRVLEAEISPDGKTIAYVAVRPRGPDEKDGAAWREVWAVPTSGGTPISLYTGAVSARSVSWTPDGANVAFLTKRKGDAGSRIYVVARGGGEPRPLVEVPDPVRAYSLSSDGKYVAFTTTGAPDRKAKAKKALKARGFSQTVYEEDLANVYIQVETLGGNTGRRIHPRGSVHELAFAPDGNSIFYTMSPTPLIDDRYMARDLYRVDLGKQGNLGDLIADVPGKFGTFAVSPDSSRVAYIAGRDINDPHESSLYVVGRDGGWAASLTPADFKGEVHRVVWIDDETLLCIGTEGCHRTVFAQSAAGGNRTVGMPAGTLIPGTLSLHRPSGTIATVAQSAAHPEEVFVLNREGKTRRLTNLNPKLAEFTMGRQEVVRYKARDGLEVEGVLVRPVGYVEGKRYPLLIAVHGGPESCIPNGWVTRYSYPGQMAAGEGYMVFYPNYRSSTGRGVAFSKMGQGDAAGPEFDDVLDGIDHLAKLGLVDPKRVGITGGSYGGYFSAWAATRHSDRFAASVMFVGISNQLSKVGTTDIPQESYYSHWKKRPWEVLPLLLERSPLMHTDKAKTPILILHGKDDPRVSPTQSMELYRWLKLRTKVPARLILYPGEGHGNRRRASQLDYALRMMRWFDHFIKKGAKRKPPSAVDYDGDQ